MLEDISPDRAARPSVRDLEPLFSPRSIAVIGASRSAGSVGHAVIRNLIHGEYQGTVYPVNPKAKSILGIRCLPRVADVDEMIDLAIVIRPAEAVQDAVTACADHGTRHFVVISAGFKEVGGDGAVRERRLGAIARQRGLSILGPNCLGVINTDPTVRMNATFARDMPRSGCFGLISQSGALCTALLDYAKGRGFGFSRFTSFGNKVDVSEIDLLWALAADTRTRGILMYVEEISGGQAFVEAAYQVTRGPDPKPVLVIKTGRTPQGAAAAASHTGSMAGSDEVYDAIMHQAGIERVESVEELFDLAEGFADSRLPRGSRTAIVTNAGGPGIMATDACVRYGLQLAHFQDYTMKSLRFQLPPTSAINNPVDVIGDARHDRYRAALDAVTADEGVDQIMVILTPQNMTDVAEIARVIGETKEFCDKPMAACFMGLVDVSPGVELLQHKYGVPTFGFPENAMRALAAKTRFAEWVRKAARDYRRLDVDRRAVEEDIASEIKAGRNLLVEIRALDLLRHYGFPIVPHVLARTADEAIAAANQIGYPVAMKISGPLILHKTDVGGVRLEVPDGESVRATFAEMVRTVRERAGDAVEIWGVLVQKMLPPGKETIIGLSRDERFGPLLMFGLGGIYTEALRDVSFRLAPIRENVASEMIKDIRAYRLLEGVRGETPSDVAAIADCLLRLSQLATDHPGIQELDINPLVVYPRGKGAVVADARIILSAEASSEAALAGTGARKGDAGRSGAPAHPAG